METKQVTADTILTEWRKLQAIRERPEYGWRFWLLGKARHQTHYDQYGLLQSMMRSNQDALYELVFSGQITDEKELHELIFFGGDGGSVAKEHNRHWVGFITRIRQRSSELPMMIQYHLEWLQRVHGY